ncbi:phosphatase PAP2 family protein [Anaerosalibacter massiliensis]|uniref:Phosphatase PAP2 family protein n=1 Tax=Anaerosalibacter massiliensis TaxID=1347392 RepID=A0A9X2S4G4_9FIRM|nr:phosphatase PAP2 family protein [Anaerosalibacter massiliensis]MCR2043244.1 phosphatase PAP2 family protein [Anaerosalibacter massiliensis]
MKRHRKTNSFDRKILNWFNSTIKSSFLDKFMYMATDLGSGIFNTILLIILILFGNGKLRFVAVEAAISISISQIIVQILKRSLGRERPYKVLQNINTFGLNLKDYSFPSGHTTAGFSMATIFALNYSYLIIPVIVLAFIIGISRMYLGVHYPTDVVGGIIVGIVPALFVHFKLLIHIEKILVFLELI